MTERWRRSGLRHIVATVGLSLPLACSDAASELAPPPWDDDTARLGHCDFEPAPTRNPAPPRDPAQIRAGYGSAVLAMPIGAPLAAYGDRVVALGSSTAPDARASRWATAMTPSAGVYDAMRAEALALISGDDEPLIIMRVDAGFITEGVLFELEAALSARANLRGRILLSASHSHAAWGAWMPTMHLVPGADAPRRELLNRAVDALRSAAEDALDNMKTARIGVAVERDFDPEDRITRDRREENDELVGPDGNTAGKNKDPIAWAMRVDDEDGNPIVGVLSLAVHGTVGAGANPIAATDAPGAIARAAEAALGYPVMHLQGAAGDVSPAANAGRTSCSADTRCYDVPRLEVLGARAAVSVAPLLEGIETEPRAAFEMVTRSFPVGRGGSITRPDGQELYYLPPDPEGIPDFVMFDAQGRASSPFDEFNTNGGAGLCGGDTPTFAPLPASVGLSGPYESCIDLDNGAEVVLSIFEMPPPILPECGSVRATGAALRVAGLSGGDWLLIGIPGEPTAPYAHYLRSRSPAGPERTLLIGYADEYTGYMLTAEDWLTGGYECGTNIWGPREGEQVLEALIEAADLAWTPEIEDPEAGTTRFTEFGMAHEGEVEAGVTTDHGTRAADDAVLWWPDTTEAVSTQPAATVERGIGVVRFAWHGGDPAIDYPEVTVERFDGTAWMPLTDASGKPATSFRGTMVVTYTPDPLDSQTPTSHLYAATWQPTAVEPFLGDAQAPFALPTGTYRLHATGRALAADGTDDYEVVSAAFEVVPMSLHAESSLSLVGGAAEIVARVGPAPGLRALRDGVSDGLLPLPGTIWTVIFELDDASTVMETVSPDPEGVASVSLDPAILARIVSADVRDAVGNGGALVP